MTKDTIIDIWAWLGVVAILVAFALNNFGILGTEMVWYQVLNIFGALGIAIDALGEKNYQPAVLNGIWLIVAFIALISILR